MKRCLRRFLGFGLSALGMFSMVCAAAPFSVGPVHAADFYAGKTIELIVSSGAGSGPDINARLVARHWGDHIPGKPAIVVKNMTGGGHVRAANYMANQAPRDGTTLGSFVPAFMLTQVLKTNPAVKFDAAKFNWIGASSASNSTVFVWHSSPVQSVSDAKTTQVIMGATGSGSHAEIYPQIMNAILGTKFKIVSGYAKTPDVNLAMERGEVQGSAGTNFESLKLGNAEWLRDGKIRIIAQVGLTRDPDYPDVPLLIDLARNDKDRSLFRLFSTDTAVGRSFMTTPDVPADRLAILRTSFTETMKDPAFLKEAKAAGTEVAPISAEALQKIVQDLVDTPPDVIAQAQALLKGH